MDRSMTATMARTGGLLPSSARKPVLRSQYSDQEGILSWVEHQFNNDVIMQQSWVDEDAVEDAYTGPECLPTGDDLDELEARARESALLVEAGAVGIASAVELVSRMSESARRAPCGPSVFNARVRLMWDVLQARAVGLRSPPSAAAVARSAAGLRLDASQLLAAALPEGRPGAATPRDVIEAVLDVAAAAVGARERYLEAAATAARCSHPGPVDGARVADADAPLPTEGSSAALEAAKIKREAAQADVERHAKAADAHEQSAREAAESLADLAAPLGALLDTALAVAELAEAEAADAVGAFEAAAASEGSAAAAAAAAAQVLKGLTFGLCGRVMPPLLCALAIVEDELFAAPTRPSSPPGPLARR
ncbi:hypothetical protein FNF27_02539 [Cafeteria roenbergensis]|uniref:Uncharacterized protein n=1 Tax=Cafeteria roenbergensis TaxID=33653 RepID=A0A5A8EEY3_CAFRO|nr:hypothetical protein FNF27_02539 [Cafeteria roenbergensis]